MNGECDRDQLCDQPGSIIESECGGRKCTEIVDGAGRVQAPRDARWRRLSGLTSGLLFAGSIAAAGLAACTSSNSSPGASDAAAEDATGPSADATAEDAGAEETGASTSDAGSGDTGASDAGPTRNVAIAVPELGIGFNYYQGAYSLGWSFIANSAIQITQLGFYDYVTNTDGGSSQDAAALDASDDAAFDDAASEGGALDASASEAGASEAGTSEAGASEAGAPDASVSEDAGFFPGNSDTQSHPVGIYDKASKALLATVIVSPTDPLTGFFRYAPLAQPLTLTPGNTYVIMANVGSDEYLAFARLDPSWTVTPAITYSGGAVNYANPDGTHLYPDTFTSNAADFGPNFEFTGP